jgi:hypothetical protein
VKLHAKPVPLGTPFSNARAAPATGASALLHAIGRPRHCAAASSGAGSGNGASTRVSGRSAGQNGRPACSSRRSTAAASNPTLSIRCGVVE